MGQVDDPILHLHELAGRLEIGHHPRAGLHHREAGVGARLCVERAVGLQDVDHRQLLPQADVVVVGIVGRRDLHAARAHLGLRPFISHEGNRPAEQREPHLPTVLRHRREGFEHGQQVAMPHLKVLDRPVDIGMLLGRCGGTLFTQRLLRLGKRSGRRRVHGHRRVAKQRLGPRRGHRHAGRLARLRVDDVVADVPEVALHLLVKHLVVAHGGLQERVPVDQPLAATDEALLEEPEERLADGPGALVVEREPHPIPVATGPHVAKLPEDPLLILLFPGPDPLDEFFPAEVVAGEFFFLEQSAFDDRLRGDARVVGAGHPERVVALHPSRADEEILQAVVEGMAEVEGARDIRRWNDDRECFLFLTTGIGACGRRFGMPIAAGVPEGAAAGLGCGVVVLLRQFVHGVACLWGPCWRTAKCSGKRPIAAMGRRLLGGSPGRPKLHGRFAVERHVRVSASPAVIFDIVRVCKSHIPRTRTCVT